MNNLRELEAKREEIYIQAHVRVRVMLPLESVGYNT
jgi:hypothetical protein